MELYWTTLTNSSHTVKCMKNQMRKQPNHTRTCHIGFRTHFLEMYKYISKTNNYTKNIQVRFDSGYPIIIFRS